MDEDGIYEKIPADEIDPPDRRIEQAESRSISWPRVNDPDYETLPGSEEQSRINSPVDRREQQAVEEDPYMFIEPTVPESTTINNNIETTSYNLNTVRTGRTRLMGEKGIKLGSLDFRKLENVTASKRTKWGSFINPWNSWSRPSIPGTMKWLFSKNNRAIPSKTELDKTLPIISPNIQEWKRLPPTGIRVTWLGHACVLVQFDGITILTDPIFSTRCSPSRYFGPKRYRSPPCDMHDLPNIDAVVISHAHYDHLDLPTVKFLNARFGSNLRFFVPLGLMNWMTKAGCENVIEMDWWQENGHPNHTSITFAFTPTQHWSNRAIHDNGWYLWGSWCVFGPNHSFFFGGDTGYCEVFKEIGRRYGPFDLSALPIGAYEPRWFLKPQHVNPEEAVQVHVDLQSSASIGIHWGTFPLGKEFYLEPPRLVKEEMLKKGLNPDDFFTLNHGESRLLYAMDASQNEDMSVTGQEEINLSSNVQFCTDGESMDDSCDDKSLII